MIRAGERTPHFDELRREMALHHCKWDAQVGDVGTDSKIDLSEVLNGRLLNPRRATLRVAATCPSRPRPAELASRTARSGHLE